jgi:IclR family KDG regulon transcriptional repressor
MRTLTASPRTDTERPERGSETQLDTSVGKALTLLDALASFDGEVGVTTLARATGIPKSTAFRLLAILEERALVKRVGSMYVLGMHVFELGNRVTYCRPRGLRDFALPHLADMHVLTRETVHLAVLDGGDIVYLEKLHGQDAAPSPSHVGGRIPAHCSALGKVLMAFTPGAWAVPQLDRALEARTPYTIVDPRLLATELAAVREVGHAIDREEAKLGLTCVAAPVLAANGPAIAAISISGRTTRFIPERYAAVVRGAADDIARACRAGGFELRVPCGGTQACGPDARRDKTSQREDEGLA